MNIQLKDWEAVSDRHYTHIYPDSTGQDSYFCHEGMILQNCRTYNLMDKDCLSFELWCGEQNTYTVTLELVVFRNGKGEQYRSCQACLSTGKTGSFLLAVPMAAFDIAASADYALKFTRRITISGEQPFAVTTARACGGGVLALTVPVRGQEADEAGCAAYQVMVENSTGEPVQVNFLRQQYGDESDTRVDLPKSFELAAFAQREVTVKVVLSDRVVPGGYEKQRLLIIPDGNALGMKKLTLHTAAKRPHPYVLVTAPELAEIKEKIRTEQWAKDNYEAALQEALAWESPLIDGNRPFLFWTEDGHQARRCAILYRLSGRTELKEKAVWMLKQLADPEIGYLANPRACNQEMVHEGEFFKSIVFAYDLLYHEPELSAADHHNIRAVLRKFMGYFDEILCSGNISNWAVAEMCGALYSACVLQDYAMIKRFLFGKGGMKDQMSRGILSDGWWFEVSIGYNLLAAGIFSEIAAVMLHFGMDLRYLQVPASYKEKISGEKILQDGLVAENWGPNEKTYRNIPMLWDSLVEYYDYRGVIFGINDSSETKVTGTARPLFDSRYDIAYHLYGKPEYAGLLSLCDNPDRDLLFGAARLPEQPLNTRGTGSACADSPGVMVLRSQKPGRAPREQIQAVLKYGSHGGAHGHYDRGSMNSLMRYGRSLTGPENIWYSYHTFMYKFYVQNSLNHNMVVTDLKLQEAVKPKRLLFYAGGMMQAGAVENFGRWSHPPYGGWQVNGDKTLRERSWHEGRYLPTPDQEPEYAVRSEFTKPVLTRRLMVVTDDFVANFDYAKGEQEHVFDCVYHLQGLRTVLAKGRPAVPDQTTQQLDDDYKGSAQFITDCHWYHEPEQVKLSFETEYTRDKNNGNQWLSKNRTGFNEYGKLSTDLYVAYPEKIKLVTGADPEYADVNKQLFYQVCGDDKTLASGQFGSWILGRHEIRTDIRAVRQLTLITRVNPVEFEESHFRPVEKSIFWGDPLIVTRSGKKLYLRDLLLHQENVDCRYEPGQDYYGGPVKIQGKTYRRALGAEPLELLQEARITLSLEGLEAVEFIAAIGGDYPLGEEEGRRQAVLLRQKAREASWITVLEPVETEHQIEAVSADNRNCLRVKLKADREMVIQVQGLDHPDGNVQVQLSSYERGVLVREEWSY